MKEESLLLLSDLQKLINQVVLIDYTIIILGGAAMYDYMKALQKRFDRQEHSELDEQVKCAQEELRRDMDAAGRRKLLRMIDTQNSLLAESTLMSFTAGFKLAWGMARELEADGLYSFEREEEEHICHPAEQED